ncbi:hypothetical protein MASR2M18_14370 [Ignavibacteria bacterium]
MNDNPDGFSAEQFWAIVRQTYQISRSSASGAIDAGRSALKYFEAADFHILNDLTSHDIIQAYCFLCKTLSSAYIHLTDYASAAQIINNMEQKARQYNITPYIICAKRIGAKIEDKYGSTAVALSLLDDAFAISDINESEQIREIIALYATKGYILCNIGEYPEAVAALQRADDMLFEPHNFDLNIHSEILQVSGNIQMRLQKPDIALRYYRQSFSEKQKSGDILGAARILGNIFIALISQNDIEQIENILPQLNETFSKTDDKLGSAITHINIGAFFLKNKWYDNANRVLFSALSSLENCSDDYNSSICHFYLAQLYNSKDWPLYSSESALEYIQSAYLLVSDKHGFTHYIANIEKVWSEICESSGDIFGALQHFKQYNNFEKQVLNEKSERSIHELNTKHEIEIIERERIATDRLLYKMLPAVIVPRMKNGEKIADYFDSASIMFADMENFTTFSQLITPEQLIDILGVVFEVFDETIQAYGCEKIKTIGDSYMAVSGVPVFYDNHAERMASAILIIRDTLSERIVSYINDIADNLPPIHFRYGLHTGHIIAGIVGQERSLYDIYGDSVNIAARMESSGVSDTIQCSEGFVQHFIARGNGIILSGSSAKRFASENNNTMFSRFYFRERGIINIKGKGNMKTYFLEFAE